MRALLLSRASLRCLWRRALGLPLPAALALVAALTAAPPLLWRTGAAVGAAVGPALEREEAARALVLGTSLAAAVTGAVLALTAPRLASLGQQLAAAPVGRRAASVALVVVPAAAVGVLVAPGSLALVVPVGAAGPAGPAGGAVLAAFALAGIAGGVAAAEIARAARARSGLALPAAVLVATPWAAGAVPGMGAVPGPLEGPALALAGRTSPAAALVLAAVATLLAGAAWLVAVGVEPRQTRRRPARVGSELPRHAAACAFEAARRLLWRRREMRGAACAGAALGLTGAGVGLLLGSPPALVVAQGAAAPVLAGAVAPVAAAGLARRGAHVWGVAPGGCRRAALAWSAAALLSHALLVATVAVVCAAVARARFADAAPALQGAVLAGAAALVAGAAVPWQGERLGDQLASFAAFGGIVVLAGALVAAVAGRLDGAGVPPAVTAATMTLGLVVVGVVAVRARLEGPGRC